jgi:hypothetical protein
MRRFFEGKVLAVAAVVGGAVLASVAPVMAEVSADSPSDLAVRIESPAKWLALGAAINVPVSYACPVGTDAGLTLTVNQAVAGGLATGLGRKHDVPCTGRTETAIVNVLARDHAFRWGTAYGEVSLNKLVGGVTDRREFRIAP